MSKPKTRADFFRKWAWLIEQCEGTPMEGLEGKCLKVDGVVWHRSMPPFISNNPKHYEFMIGLLEGKPVFDGDQVWYKNLNRYDFIDNLENTWRPALLNELLSWQKPKDTITINGVELPEPKQTDENGYLYQLGSDIYSFGSQDERQEFKRSLGKIIRDAIKHKN